MVVGININGVLRDFFGKIEMTHEKYFPLEDEGKEIKVLDYDLERWVTFEKKEIEKNELVFDPNFNEQDFISTDKELEIQKVTENEEVTLQEFLYEKCCLEIFGYANETINGAVQSINELQLELKDKHKLIITSREADRSIPSTLFFLSKTGCMIQDIKFTMGTKDCWDFVDVMVTDHPEVLNSKPEGKKTIKVEKIFNQEISADYTIKSVKELIGLELFN